MENMWSGFTDFELATLAVKYDMQHKVEFGANLKLINREQLEELLTEHELKLAFGE